ncbi:MAG: methylaspartate mutase [Candidatus Cloacimonadota bacterium]|nr:MAG: methylaspartate mutase [Candidatus Cloacimonadota bacterium]PIE78253.1 MAG: methylaspartate mutase [Candidatus Delongbacteria bacterium]
MSKEVTTIIATDCGSTTTKAILIEKVGDEYRQLVRGEAPTTVEAPFEDVTRGVLNAVMELEELATQYYARDEMKGSKYYNKPRKFIENEQILRPKRDNNGIEEGCDIYISTSSAGGGLQMMVFGVVKGMTAESAERAALGAGAIVMDTLAINDGRLPHEKIERIRALRPDMILIAGETDSAKPKHVISMSELVKSARPTARLGAGFSLPVIYAGNSRAQDQIRDILEDSTALNIVPNLRPSLEEENLRPASDKIHDLFMEHVMQQAPGYDKLMKWTDAPIMPTPGAVGLIIQKIGKIQNKNVVGVDIGGATTDVFSVFKLKDQNGMEQQKFNRTVSANLGMSYSVSNVLLESGVDNIMRWVPFETDEHELRNRIGNKMIRPTTIPQNREDLIIEQAICREALRLSFIQHRAFAVGLKGVQQQKSIADAFDDASAADSIVKMRELDILVGSGGVLSHAPLRSQSAHMMLDAFLPEGITALAVDSIFMMPQLGVLSDVDRPGCEQAAMEVFDKDCLIHLAQTICPIGVVKEGKNVVRVKAVLPDGNKLDRWFTANEVQRFDFDYDTEVMFEIEPAKGFDVGGGKGKKVSKKLRGGVVGLIIDTRGRPFKFSKDFKDRINMLNTWDISKNYVPKSKKDGV